MTKTRYPIFVVTLEGDETRRAPLVDWLEAHGLEHELFFGVDARRGLPADKAGLVDQARARRRLGRELTPAEIGCALSHLEVYRQIGARELPGAIVLEDDAVPTEAFARFVEARGYLKAPMILLDHANTRVWRSGAVDLGGGITGFRLAMSPFLASGYALDAATAAGLLAESQPVHAPADWPVDLSRFGALAAMPRLVTQPPGNPLSHLSAERDRTPTSALQRARRFFSPNYWRRWLRKRLSRRIAD